MSNFWAIVSKIIYDKFYVIGFDWVITHFEGRILISQYIHRFSCSEKWEFQERVGGNLPRFPKLNNSVKIHLISKVLQHLTRWWRQKCDVSNASQIGALWKPRNWCGCHRRCFPSIINLSSYNGLRYRNSKLIIAFSTETPSKWGITRSKPETKLSRTPYFG